MSLPPTNGGTSAGAPSPSLAFLRNTIQTGLRPIMVNVRRSSLGGNVSHFPRSGGSTSGQENFVSEGMTSAAENHPYLQTEANLNESQNKSVTSLATGVASQVVAELLEGACVSSGTPKGPKRGILNRFITRSRNGSKKSSSTVESCSVANFDGATNEDLETAVIETVEEEQIEGENSSSTEEVTKKKKQKGKFAKKFLFLRRLQKSVRRKTGSTRRSDKDGNVQAIELKDRATDPISDGVTAIFPTSDGENMEGTGASGETAEASAVREQGDTDGEMTESKIQFTEISKGTARRSDATDIYDAMEISTAIQNGEFVVSVVGDTAEAILGRTRRRLRKIKSYGEPGLTERCINLQYYMALSPYRFDKKGRIVTNWRSKLAYISTNVVAFLFGVGQIRILIEQKSKDLEIQDPIYYYILIACQAAFIMVQARLFQFRLFDQKDARRAIKADRRCPLTSTSSNRILAVGLRIYSALVSIFSAFAGFGVVHEMGKWSMELLLTLSESAIYIGFLRDALRFQQAATAGHANDTLEIANSTILGNVTFTTISPFTTTTSESTSSEPITNDSPAYAGWFINDGVLETRIIGCAGLFMNICYRMVITSASELASSSTWSLWGGMRKLKFAGIMDSQRDSGEKSEIGRGGENVEFGEENPEFESDSDSGTDMDTEDEEYSEDMKQQVLVKVNKYEGIRRVANKKNDAFKTFWPWLALAALMTTSVILFCLGEGRWFTAFGLILSMLPTFVDFYFGIILAMIADDINIWYSSKRAQAAIKASCKEFGMTMTQMVFQPFGFGTGLFYISSGFVVGFFAAAVTYCFSQSQAAHGQAVNNICNCTH